MIRARVAAAASLVALAGGGWTVPAHAAPPSTTTVVLTKATSAYGDTVRATAQVDAGGALVDGDIWFVVDGTSYKTNATPSGSQTFVLPSTAAVGTHSVSARFVPRLPNQSPSESAPTSWVVTKARTLVQVRVTGRGVRIPTAVVLGALGDYGTVPTGAVGVSVRHLGTGKVTLREKALDRTGAATARLGVLRTGRYRVRVTYAGDTQHLAATRSATFRVGPR